MRLPKINFDTQDTRLDDELKSFIGGREIIVFENDLALTDSIMAFYAWCIEMKQRISVYYHADQLPLSYVEGIIGPDTVIAFMTTERHGELIDGLTKYLAGNKGYRTKIIECYIDKPVLRRIPDGCKHLEVITLEADSDELTSTWTIEKLD